ncbi:hypothetical protein HDU76_006285 [Blyttiomyces sp. JEL0837]|nr:hypothetical protein HDU76_006285 [Blyttiomyces sp. JEL0837]
MDTDFEAATQFVASASKSMKQEHLLKRRLAHATHLNPVFGISKAAQSEDHWTNDEIVRKWEAWKSAGELSKDDASRQYVEYLEEVSSWKRNHGSQNSESVIANSASDSGKSASSAGGMGVGVSVMAYEEEEVISDSDKTLNDWIKEGNIDQVRRLCNDGVNVKLADEDGVCPIHWASDRGHPTIVQLLLESGADVNATDSEGLTALHYAAITEHDEVIRILLNFGADRSRSDSAGETPENYAPTLAVWTR